MSTLLDPFDPWTNFVVLVLVVLGIFGPILLGIEVGEWWDRKHKKISITIVTLSPSNIVPKLKFDICDTCYEPQIISPATKARAIFVKCQNIGCNGIAFRNFRK